MVFTQLESNSLNFTLSGFINTDIYSSRQSAFHMGAVNSNAHSIFCEF